jgi:PASTA domain-containing protein
VDPRLERIEEQPTELEVEGYPLRETAFEEPVASEPFRTPPPPTEPGPRRRPSGWWALVGAVLVLLAGLGTAYGVTRGASPGAHAARQNRPTAGKTVPATPTQRTPGAVPANPVPPAPGASSAAATRRPKTTVPTVVGHTLPDAVTLLRRAGLTALITHLSSTQPLGRVVGQRPSAGTRSTRGSRVRLEVSVQRPVVVPSVIGMTGLAARKRLEAEHFVVSLRYVPSTQPARRVVAQSPRPGTKRQRGAGVLINLSNGTRPSAGSGSGSASATVPDVVGEDEATAVSDLETAGFAVDTVGEPTGDPGQDGIVLDQDPNGGATAAGSSTVTIHVGRYSGG